jgi:hypothetical protein
MGEISPVMVMLEGMRLTTCTSVALDEGPKLRVLA